MSRRNTTQWKQKRAWGYYGYDGADVDPVGEVHYVILWHADQMTRLDWDIHVNGSDVWSVTLPPSVDADGNEVAGEVISTTNTEGEQDLTAASARLLELIDWTDDNIRAIDTNLLVGGEGDYAQLVNEGYPGNGWIVVSVVEDDRDKKLRAANASIPFLWPHPAKRNKPDAPLFSVITVLDKLDWLDRQETTQSKQRALTSGILAVADGFSGTQDKAGEAFWNKWNTTMRARMENPDDLSPIELEGSLELIKDGVNWIIPPGGYDATIDRRQVAAINRLAYGLPVPPEILLGMQAQSRATAFQVEENAYRAHIEPPAKMVAQVAEDALNLLLEDDTVKVTPNPSKLLARKNSVQDVKDAYDRGEVSGDYLREVLGIPDDAAPSDEERAARAAGQTVPPAAEDPSNDAADEPVTAAASEPDLSTLLADIDAALSSELAGVTVMAVDRARQRLGAAARTTEKVRSNGHTKLSNADLAVYLGFDGLSNAGVDVAERITEPIDSACSWWIRRVGEAWTQAQALIPTWAGQGDWVTESTDVLAERLSTHILATLDDDDSSPLPAGDIRVIVDAAAGGN